MGKGQVRFANREIPEGKGHRVFKGDLVNTAIPPIPETARGVGPRPWGEFSEASPGGHSKYAGHSFLSPLFPIVL